MTEELMLAKIAELEQTNVLLEIDKRTLEMTLRNWHLFLESARKDGRYSDSIPKDRMVFRDKDQHPKPLTIEEVAAYHQMTDVKALLGINTNDEVVTALVQDIPVSTEVYIAESPSNFDGK